MTEGEQLVGQLMRFLPEGLSANGWALRAGVSRTIWSDLRRHGNPSRRTLEKLLGSAGSSIAEFEALRADPVADEVEGEPALGDRNWGWKGAPLAPLPVVHCAEAGRWREGSLTAWQIDRSRRLSLTPRPPSLAADGEAFALTVPGKVMAPRFRTGRTIAISPAMSVAPGEDVLVRLVGSDPSSGFRAIPGALGASLAGTLQILQPGGAEDAITREAIHSVIVIAGELF